MENYEFLVSVEQGNINTESNHVYLFRENVR